MPAGYPVVLDLAGRLAVVAGGGLVATRRIRGLLAAGARVRVVAPEATAELEDLAGAGRLDLLRRAWRPGDLDGAALVIAATSSAERNRQVAAEARAAGIAVNVASEPATGTLPVPAVLRRGDLLLAVGTSGQAPGLAGALRRRLAELFGPEWAELVGLLGELRGRLPDPADRAGWDRLLAPELLDAVRAGDLALARTLILRHADTGSR